MGAMNRAIIRNGYEPREVRVEFTTRYNRDFVNLYISKMFIYTYNGYIAESQSMYSSSSNGIGLYAEDSSISANILTSSFNLYHLDSYANLEMELLRDTHDGFKSYIRPCRICKSMKLSMGIRADEKISYNGAVRFIAVECLLASAYFYDQDGNQMSSTSYTSDYPIFYLNDLVRQERNVVETANKNILLPLKEETQ